MGIEERFFKMEDKFSEDAAMVIYGPEGVGKTTLAASLKNLLYIDVEKGRSSILKTKFRPQIFQPDNPEDLGEVYLWLKANSDKFDAVVIDTYTEVEKWFISQSIQKGVNKDPDKDPDLATMNDYNKAGRRMSKMTRSFHSLPMLKVYLCHEREDKDEDTGEIKRGPALMPAVMRDLNAYVDVILYMNVDKEGNRALYTTPTSKYRAKHRIGSLPKKIQLPDDPNRSKLSDVVEMVEKSLKEGPKKKEVVK